MSAHNSSFHDAASTTTGVKPIVLDEEAADEWPLYRASFARSIKTRFVIVAVSLSIWLVGFAGGVVHAPLVLLVLLPAVTLLANQLARAIYRRELLALWHLTAFLLFDAALIGANVVALGALGYLGGPFYIVAATAYGLSLPLAARDQMVAGCIIYPFARFTGLLLVGLEPSFGLLGMETAALAGLGWLAIQGPVRSTFRIRRARHGLQSLELGDYSVRLPTRALDDLGLVAVSFNRTAETLGATVASLRSEISERERVEAELAFQAFHDALTGLANRALFRDRVTHALARDSRREGGVAVLFLDLDNFKLVNDSMGHAEGDRLLTVTAGRLLNATRGGDTVARMGGDEFAVLLENVHTDEAVLTVTERILSSLSYPIALNDRDVQVGVSIGIARARLEDNAEELLRNADVAMYSAKQGGKGRYELFAPEMYDEMIDRMELEADLDRAMTREEFRLVYQPIVELSSGAVTGVETLLRWEHPHRGTVPPMVFIPVAETTGLIIELGRWVLLEACRQGAGWVAARSAGSDCTEQGDNGSAGRRTTGEVGAAMPPQLAMSPGPLSITVNVSGHQLQHDEFISHLTDALTSSGLPPSCLVLEITESVIMQDTDWMLQRLHDLKGLGVRLAIDDFGTGYSSLGFLQKFPVDILKIDKAFIDSVAHGGQHAALARTILALGDMLSLRCVAEGIEDADQRHHLLSLGCEMGQGYLFARPLQPDEIGRLLDTGSRSSVPVSPGPDGPFQAIVGRRVKEGSAPADTVD